jgi:hypothetical protein
MTEERRPSAQERITAAMLALTTEPTEPGKRRTPSIDELLDGPYVALVRMDGKGGYPYHYEPLHEYLEEAPRWTQQALRGEYAPDWRLAYIGAESECIEMLYQLERMRAAEEGGK